MSGLFFSFVNVIGDGVVKPFSWVSASMGLIIMSILCAVVLLSFFKILSNQEKIRHHKNIIIGYILETAIYRDQFLRIAQNQLYILKHNFIYLRYVATPFLIMMVPMTILCMQIENRVGCQPLSRNDTFIIQAELDDSVSKAIASDIYQVQCRPSKGIVLETKALRIESQGKVFWRARVEDPAGSQYIQLLVNNSQDHIQRSIATAAGEGRFTNIMSKAGSLNYFFFNAEAPIPDDSVFKAIHISYKPTAFTFFFWRFSPIIHFFLLTILFGVLAKPFLGVNI